MSTTCEFCNKNFSCKSVLVRHKNTSKKCIESRKKDCLTCSNCSFFTYRKSALDYHVRNCKESIIARDVELQVTKKELEYTKQILDRQLEKTTNTTIKTDNSIINQNKTNNTLNIQYEFYKQILSPLEELEEKFPTYISQHYTEQYLDKGVKGLAEVSSNLIYGNPRFCVFSDNTGRNAYYKTSEGSLIKDDNARDITTIAINAAEPVISEIANKKLKKIYEQLATTDNEDDTNELNKQCITIKNNVNNIKDIRNDNRIFRKHLAHKGYISKETVFQNLDNPQLLLEEEKDEIFISKTRLLDILTQKNAKYEISKISDEMLKYVLHDAHTIVNFIINKFLTINGELIYDYDKTKNCFIYYEKEDVDDIELKQCECDGELPYTFMCRFSLVQMSTKKCKEEYNKIRNISKDEFVNILKINLLIRKIS